MNTPSDFYHIIVNPASRSGKGYRVWKEQIKPLLAQRKVSYTPYFSEDSGDASRIAAQIAAENPEGDLRLIVMGGDGTLNEVLQGLDTHVGRTVLGYIPSGSSNDFARDLGLPTNPFAAMDTILITGRAHTMDLGCIRFPDGSKRYFNVSCGIGFDAAVCEQVQRSTLKLSLNKLGLGKLTYLGIALGQIFRAKRDVCTLTLDGDRTVRIPKLLFLAGMNHRYEGGGFMFCPDALDDDGLLDLCVVGGLPKPLIPFALPTAFFGKHFIFPKVDSYRARTFRVETAAPLWVHTDGEVVRQADSFEVTCLPGAIRILM